MLQYPGIDTSVFRPDFLETHGGYSMTNPAASYSTEQSTWLAQLAESHLHILALAQTGKLDHDTLSRLAETEAHLALALLPMPANVVDHLRAAYGHARQYLERLPQHDPTREVVADPTHSYTPRKILRRVLDHTLDHLNQIEQWLIWQQHATPPTPTDGWADSATTLEEDRLPLTPADLKAWLWRIDLAVEMVAQRAASLSAEQLDWIPPDGGWSLRHVLHHLASAEVYYAIWLDKALSEEPVARYTEATQRFDQHLRQVLDSSADTHLAFFQGGTSITIEQAVQQVLEAEQELLNAIR